MSEAEIPREGETLVFECALDEAPEKVWRALTVPERVAAWLMPGDFRPEMGARFTLQGADGAKASVACAVEAVETGRLLRLSWRDDDARRSGLPSSVTFELEPTGGGGTILKIVHRFAATAHKVVPAAANANLMLDTRLAA